MVKKLWVSIVVCLRLPVSVSFMSTEALTARNKIVNYIFL